MAPMLNIDEEQKMYEKLATIKNLEEKNIYVKMEKRQTLLPY